MRERIAGHVWTIAPVLRDAVRPIVAPRSNPWRVTIDDPRLGVVRLGGRLREEPDADTLLLVVHGLGGSADSPCVRRAAAAASAIGWSSLRIDLRGADGLGEDVYHAALVDDLRAALHEPRCRRYTNVYVIGYSLGGHVTLRFAAANLDPRVRAVAAICAPLDLQRSAATIDRTRAWFYRSHVLRNLKRGFRTVAARRDVWRSLAEIERARTIRQWDSLVVVPRHGFADVDDYYATASVGPLLRDLPIPALWIGARHDPMVPADTVAPSLARARATLDVRWIDDGGHVGFPGHHAIESAALTWLREH